MTMTEKTKVADILDAYPWLSEELPKHDERFAVLNTFAGKLMVRTMTIADVSRIAGTPAQELIEELEEILKKHEAK